MSKRLILLARPYALSQSRWVQLELERFIALHRSPIVVEFPAAAGTVTVSSPLAELLANRRSIREELSELDGPPSDAVVQELVRSFDATRQETVRMRALGGAVVLFIIIAAAAAWQWYEAVQERRVAEAQRSDAQAASHFAEASRTMAEWDLEAGRHAALLAESERLKESAGAERPDETSALRLSNLRGELAESDTILMKLSERAAASRSMDQLSWSW